MKKLLKKKRNGHEFCELLDKMRVRDALEGGILTEGEAEAQVITVFFQL